MYFKIGTHHIICDRPDKVGAEQAMNAFYELYSPILEGKTMWALDIGVACGDSTLVMASCLAPQSCIIAFEPGREAYPLLLANLARNKFCRCDTYPVAASNEYGMLGFISSAENGGVMLKESTALRGKDIPESFVLSVSTLNYLSSRYSQEELRQVGFIKIDCEGFDYVILNNLAPLIVQNRPTVIVEWWPDPIINGKLFAVIDSLKYTAFNSRKEPVSQQDFHTNKRTQDLILLPL